MILKPEAAAFLMDRISDEAWNPEVVQEAMGGDAEQCTKWLLAKEPMPAKTYTSLLRLLGLAPAGKGFMPMDDLA